MTLGTMYRVNIISGNDNPYDFPDKTAVFVVPIKDYNEFYLCRRYDKEKRYLYNMCINKKDIYSKRIRVQAIDSSQSSLSIVKLSLSGEFIARYDIVRDAATERIRTGGIYNVLYGRQNSAYGYKWMYEKDWLKAEVTK